MKEKKTCLTCIYFHKSVKVECSHCDHPFGKTKDQLKCDGNKKACEYYTGIRKEKGK